MTEAKKKIIHVDDDRNMQVLVKAVLERAGHEVFTACDAAQGLELARSVRPDLVMLDMMMPGGGPELRACFRGLAARVPILIYSGSETEALVRSLSADPLTAILQKPAPPKEIVAAVRTLLDAAAS